jgi:hypothetical protein
MHLAPLCGVLPAIRVFHATYLRHVLEQFKVGKHRRLMEDGGVMKISLPSIERQDTVYRSAAGRLVAAAASRDTDTPLAERWGPQLSSHCLVKSVNTAGGISTLRRVNDENPANPVLFHQMDQTASAVQSQLEELSSGSCMADTDTLSIYIHQGVRRLHQLTSYILSAKMC